MKLKRAISDKSTAGLWESADGRWVLTKNQSWVFASDYQHLPERSWFIAPWDGFEWQKNKTFLQTYGLWKTPFKTRREATEALEKVLEGTF
jgi:hypothetical protein